MRSYRVILGRDALDDYARLREFIPATRLRPVTLDDCARAVAERLLACDLPGRVAADVTVDATAPRTVVSLDWPEAPPYAPGYADHARHVLVREACGRVADAAVIPDATPRPRPRTAEELAAWAAQHPCVVCGRPSAWIEGGDFWTCARHEDANW